MHPEPLALLQPAPVAAHSLALPPIDPRDARRVGQLLRGLALGFGRLAAGHIEDSAMALDTVDASTIEALDRVLGEGWVAITVRGADGSTLRAEETGFAGLWRLQRQEANGTLSGRSIEAGVLPADAAPALARVARALPTGVVPVSDRVRGLLADAVRRAQKARHGLPSHIVNLSLAELSPEELTVLDERLGSGPVSGVCLGFTTTRFAATALANVWRVRYLDPSERLILDTLEVAAFPECAAVSTDAVRASVARLDHIAGQLDPQ